MENKTEQKGRKSRFYEGDVLRVPFPHLVAENLSKSYGETPVLDGISIGVEKGKCLALLGPSGCGKSTLLNILAGLLPADSGTIRLGMELIEDAERGYFLSPQGRRFSMVFQDLSLWPHLTVAENIAFGLDYLDERLDRQSKEERLDRVLRQVGIYELRNRYPAMLSGGQQQRVAIARAIIVEPAVLLMDEPLASLDIQLREVLRDEIAALIRRLEITTVYVTHDHTEAMTVAHEVAVMRRGRIEQCAPPEEIYRYPATTFVASFLGSANHFPFTYELEDLRDEQGQALFPPHPPGSERGYLMIHREAVRVFPVSQARDFPGDGMIRWKALCVKNCFVGARHEVHAVTRKGEVFRGFTPHPVPLDCEVYVQFDPQEVIFVQR